MWLGIFPTYNNSVQFFKANFAHDFPDYIALTDHCITLDSPDIMFIQKPLQDNSDLIQDGEDLTGDVTLRVKINQMYTPPPGHSANYRKMVELL